MELGRRLRAAAGREEQRAVGELGFGAGGRAAPAGVPDPELVEQAKRRRFTAEYKARDPGRGGRVHQAGRGRRAVAPRGPVHVASDEWRKQRKDGALKELGQPRGRKPADRRDGRSRSCAGAPSAPRRSLRRRGR